MVVINCDGACHGNPGPGGWGVHLNDGKGGEHTFYGHSPHATNNEMELKAAIKAITLASPNEATQVFTDSQYVKKGITEWIIGWKAKGWITSSKTPVKNKDLWVELDALVNKKKINWGWVKGHNGDPGNEAADRAATMGANKANNDVDFAKMSQLINSGSLATISIEDKTTAEVRYINSHLPGIYEIQEKTKVFIGGKLYDGYILKSDSDTLSITASDFPEFFVEA